MMTKHKLNHFDATGQAHMVDIGHKSSSRRIAVAEGKIYVTAQAFACILEGKSHKGDILGIARIAAIQASKQTALLIPLCHPLALTHVHVDFELDSSQNAVKIQVTTETTGQTGVEMEALCAVNVGLLTIYDMLKAIDKTMRIADIVVLRKEGGQSGHYQRASH